MHRLYLFAALVAAFIFGTVAKAENGNISTEGSPDEGYAYLRNISYVDPDETDAYKLERCVLDIYYPIDKSDFATLVWIHGGGLTEGSKGLCQELRNRGFAVVDINYRLSPKATCPAYIEDAAQAVAWVFNHIEEYGGDASNIFVGGHSAGGYLTLMLGLVKDYMAKFGVDADRINKLYPVSGQTTTHYTIRTERGLPPDVPIIDEMAPSGNIRKDGAPIMLITGDRDLEMLARYEENAHLYALLRHMEHSVDLYEMKGFNHVTVLDPACILIASDIIKRTQS